MLITIAACCGAWVALHKQPILIRAIGIVVLAFVLSTLTTLLTVTLVVARVPVGIDQAAIYFIPTSYPLAIVGFHDADAMQFQFRIVLGWPDGFTLVAPGFQDDQSEFMRIQLLAHGAFLGFVTLVTSLILLMALEISNLTWHQLSPTSKWKGAKKAWRR